MKMKKGVIMMFQKEIELVTKTDFEVVRDEITEGVVGFPLVTAFSSGTKVTLTRVKPQGEFSEHRDDYHHVLYFISGNGVGWLEDEEYGIMPGRLVQIPKGTLHGYRNDSGETMTLLTINIPENEA
ncbi:MAG: cupin domain-containing protein [Candidatus Lokiarchaeota archaeon]|nr:cupin domain-containing protein [Candidatus Lokiarchaeota archaeon]